MMELLLGKRRLSNVAPTLQAVEWTYASDVARSPDASITANILQRNHFNSNLKRMSVLLRVADSKQFKGGAHYEAVLKGAPEVVKKALGEW